MWIEIPYFIKLFVLHVLSHPFQ